MQAPILQIRTWRPVARPPPGQFYLLAGSLNERIGFILYSDGNVYDDGLCKEWVEAVGKAARVYLGGEGDKIELAKL